MGELFWVWTPGCGVFLLATGGYLWTTTWLRYFIAYALALVIAVIIALAFIRLVPTVGSSDGTTDLGGHWVGFLPLEAAAMSYLAASVGLTCEAVDRAVRRRIRR